MTLAELKALAQAAGAAKEPWYSSRAFIHDTATHADAKFIAACSPDLITALVDVAEAAKQYPWPQDHIEIERALIRLQRVMGGE